MQDSGEHGTGDHLLRLLKRDGENGARSLAQVLGVSPQAIRSQLARLAARGLVTYEDRAGGVGRPRRWWRLTEQGHTRFPDGHAELSVELIADLRDTLGADALERLIVHREQRTLARYRENMAACRGLRQRVRRLAELRSAEGYMASCEETADGFVLVEDHCPICAAASTCQGFCRAELAVFQAVLGEGCTVQRSEHLLAGARRCSYVIRRRRRAR